MDPCLQASSDGPNPCLEVNTVLEDCISTSCSYLGFFEPFQILVKNSSQEPKTYTLRYGNGVLFADETIDPSSTKIYKGPTESEKFMIVPSGDGGGGSLEGVIRLQTSTYEIKCDLFHNPSCDREAPPNYDLV